MNTQTKESIQLTTSDGSSSQRDSIMKAIKDNFSDLDKNRKGIDKKLLELEVASPDGEGVFQQTLPKRKNSQNMGSSKSRGSRFRGVSKNGSKHQVFIMINKKKRFIGVYKEEEEAARVYDKLAVIFHGHKVSFS